MKGYRRYIPLNWLLGAVARMPLKVLYVFSDILFVIIYYIVRYRRKVALDNITASFPDKSPRECGKICRDFFRHFSDYIVETIKLGHISDEEIKRHMEFTGCEILDRYFDEGRSIVVYFSHCGNWEWAPSITLWMRHKPAPDLVYAQVYRPLTNKWFDAYFLRLRSRFGSVSYDKRMVFRHLLMLRRDNIQSIPGFMSDQKPSHNDPVHIVKFLNHPTAVITGTETVVRKLDMVAVYWDMQKIARGHYRLTPRVITDNASEMPEYAITDTYVKMLQETINRQPSIWLWTHKRWKNKVEYPADMQP